MPKPKLLLCGASGFIGRNLLERLLARGRYEVHAVFHRRSAPRGPRGFRRVTADLCDAAAVRRVTRGMDIVVQAAATTSGARDIVERPYHHVADNAVMNSLLLRACFDHGVKRFLFFSCTVMYSERPRAVREEDFDHRIGGRYFGSGWTKVYIEKMCEFYARLGRTRHTVLRHSNIYGPHDKFDRERSHVFGATVAKVFAAPEGGVVTVWGDGREGRDLLYVDDLLDCVEAALERQAEPFALANAGSGKAVTVAELARRIIARSGRRLTLAFDPSRPTIPFTLAVDCARARRLFGWAPKTPLDEGIDKTLAWYRDNLLDAPRR